MEIEETWGVVILIIVIIAVLLILWVLKPNVNTEPLVSFWGSLPHGAGNRGA
jgi:uncharacterized membrane protein AbrB (regulator of aidB expression)